MDDVDEDEVIDIAERLFVRIAEQIIKQEITSIRDVFRSELFEMDIEGQVIELLSPVGLLKGIQSLGIDDLDDKEKNSLLRVLTKPELGKNIVMSELLQIMENLGLYDDDDDAEDDGLDQRDLDDDELDELN